MDNNDVTLSKDYLSAIKYAKKIGNIDQMYDLSISLLSELGYQDEQTSTAAEEMGRKAAQFLNNRGKGTDCKKLL